MAKMLLAAEKYHAETLKASCLTYVQKNMAEVRACVGAFISLNEGGLRFPARSGGGETQSRTTRFKLHPSRGEFHLRLLSFCLCSFYIFCSDRQMLCVSSCCLFLLFRRRRSLVRKGVPIPGL